MNLRNLAIWGVIILGLLAVYAAVSQSGGAAMPGARPAQRRRQAGRSRSPIPNWSSAVDGKSIKSVMVRGRPGQRRLSRTTTASPPPRPIRTNSWSRPSAVGRRRRRQDHAPVDLDEPADRPPADPAAGRRVDLLHAPDAGRGARGHGLRQVQGQAADRAQGPQDLRGRRRRGRGQGRAAGGRRLPEGPGQVPAPGRQDSQGRPAGRPSRHRQDPAGPRRRGRGGRALLLDLGLGLRRDVRRRRRQPRARHVRTGQEERALHHLHRRDRRRRSSPRRRPGRRQRRARADAEPAAGRDGRLRVQRRHHPDRRDQPSRRAGPGPAASRPLRPPGRGAEPRRRTAARRSCACT